MSTLKLVLPKQQHSATFVLDRHTHAHRLAVALISIGLLIALDQITKTFALWWTPAASIVMADPSVTFGIGWHIHEPNPHSRELAILAFALAGTLWLLPVSDAAKVLWAAAALSNHVEMLMRPGTVDFLSLGLDSRIWVANIADLYFVAGIAFIINSVWIKFQTEKLKVCANISN